MINTNTQTELSTPDGMIQTPRNTTVLIHIRYCSWGGHSKDRWLWEGIVAKGGDGLEIGHGWDYGTKQYLIERCEKLGYEYQVHRYKRDGTIEILGSS